MYVFPIDFHKFVLIMAKDKESKINKAALKISKDRHAKAINTNAKVKKNG